MIRAAFAVAFAALLAAPAAAQDTAADALLVKISGPVFLRTEGSSKFVPAKGGEELLYGDSVKTGPAGVAHVRIAASDAAVLVRENSIFTLQGNPRAVSLSFSVGEFLIGLAKTLEKGHTFKVRTPAAVAAVRGTLFWGKTDEQKTSTYAGFGRTVWITAQKKTAVLKPGQKVTIPLGQPPSAPEVSDVGIAYAQNFAIDGDLQDVEKLATKPVPLATKPPAAKPAETKPAESKPDQTKKPEPPKPAAPEKK